MNRILFVLTFAAVAAGCSGSSAVYLSNALMLGAACEPGDIQQLNGSMDVGVTSIYFAGFSVGSSVLGDEVLIDGRPVSSPAASDFVANEMVLTYSIGGAAVVPEQVVPISFVVGPGAEVGDSFVIVDLMTTAAITALRTQTTFPVDLLVTMQLRGSMRGGTPASTNAVRFPITLTGNSASCPAGTNNGTCGIPGQDVSSGCL